MSSLSFINRLVQSGIILLLITNAIIHNTLSMFDLVVTIVGMFFSLYVDLKGDNDG